MWFRWLTAAVILLCAAHPVPAAAKTFRYALQGDVNSLDPYTLNETVAIGALGNVMEGLVGRDGDLKIVPALAESWEALEPLRWRFHLRKNVRFHSGHPFTADDVLFSLERLRHPASQMKARAPADMVAVKIDDHTVDFVLKSPSPLLIAEWNSWYIVSKGWAEENNASAVQPATATSLAAFALKANGTGPFRLVSHEPGIRTVFEANPDWWGRPTHNIDRAILETIKSDPTRVSALLGGDVDFIDPVPVQDIDRISRSERARALLGPELRIIFLNMDSMRDELLYASVKGRNPFKDVRVRKAFYQAIDVDAIAAKVMRGMARPAPLPIAPELFARSGEFKRHPYDPAAARSLMTDAGYPNGFEITLDCPNDRYVNDAAICQAVAAMLAQISVTVKVNAMPKARYFEKASATGKYDSSFNLLGWTPSGFDSLNVLVNIIGCRDADGRGAAFNYGGYCNPRIDEIARLIRSELDLAKRDALIAEAYRIVHDEVGLIPLHQQSLAWGVAKGVTIPQRADGLILLSGVRKD